MRIALVTLLGAITLVAVGARADDAAEVAKELKKFQGAWTFESVTAGAVELPPHADTIAMPTTRLPTTK